ncbi:MAG: LytTR family DNA-binding domain-containing protein [bacterium]
MTLIRAVIADDEALSRRLVHQLLERHADVAIVAECADGAEARDAIAKLAPDVVFLDIRMPVESGLDVARQREARTGPLVVFVTAYDKFALPAFETDAVDYLTKPLTEARFDAMLDRVRERLRLRRLAALQISSTEHDPRSPYLTYLMSRVGTRDVIVPLDDIEYIEAADVYAQVHAGGKRYLVRTPLESLEHDLDPAAFARVHRSFIVRITCVREIHRGAIMELVLDTGAVIPVSRRRRGQLAALFKPAM